MAAFLVGFLVLGGTLAMLKGRAFARRAVVELREDGRRGGRAILLVASNGRPAEAEVRLGYPDGGRQD